MKQYSKQITAMITSGLMVLIIALWGRDAVKEDIKEYFTAFGVVVSFGAICFSYFRWRFIYESFYKNASYLETYFIRPSKEHPQLTIWFINSIKWFMIIIIIGMLS